MRINTILKWGLVAIGVFVAVQFASVYVTRTQLSHIIETVAIEARRKQMTRSEIKTALLNEMNQNNTELPMQLQISSEGIGDRWPTQNYADYEHVVDLKIMEVTVSMSASGDSKPALEDYRPWVSMSGTDAITRSSASTSLPPPCAKSGRPPPCRPIDR